ncbi:hypothetical protein BH23CHL2_BH23CHL2_23900 [soil metagenome]
MAAQEHGRPQRAFSMIPLHPDRSSSKPRRQGLTMMMDWGIPLGQQKDLLGLAGPYVDLAKIVVGTARLYDDSYLKQKVACYREHDIAPFLGGQFLEYLLHTEGLASVQPFCDEARRLGVQAIEISDNHVPVSRDDRRATVEIITAAGLQVHGEVGSKADTTPVEVMIDQAREWFELGAEVVLIEAAELIVDGQPDREIIQALAAGLDITRVLFELPGPWVRGTTTSDVLYLKKHLVDTFGPDANIANVMPDDLFETEAMRLGLSFSGPPRRSYAIEGVTR